MKIEKHLLDEFAMHIQIGINRSDHDLVMAQILNKRECPDDGKEKLIFWLEYDARIRYMAARAMLKIKDEGGW